MTTCLLMVDSRSFRLRFSISLFSPVNGLLVLVVFLSWSVLSLCQRVSPPSPKKDDSRYWQTHPRAPALCAQTFNGLEGTSIKGFTFDRAIVVTTPGVTFRPSTDYLFNQDHSRSHCLFHKYAKTHPSDKIKSYTDVLWMKDTVYEKRKLGSAFKVLKTIPQSNVCKENMLTPQGITHCIQLGEYLAKSYLKTLNVVSSMSRDLFDLAHSIGDEVLYQSILAVLYGLLGEKQFVYAGVGKLSRHFTDDTKSHTQSEEHLSYFIQKSFEEEHRLFKDYSPTSERWSIDSEFGRDLSAKNILASLSLNHCDKSLEDVTQLPLDQLESVLSVSDRHNDYLLNSSIFQNFSKSTTLPFRKFLKSWILSSHKSKDIDMKLISVNELLMLHLLSTFGLSSVEHIPPASRLVIERFHLNKTPQTPLKSRKMFASRFNVLSTISSLENPLDTPLFTNKNREDFLNTHKKNTESFDNLIDPRNVYFRVLYNGMDVTGELWNCRSDFLVGLGLCSLPTFSLDLEPEESKYFDELKDEL